MPRLKPGQTAPGAQLRTMDGDEITLAEAWSGNRYTLLIFLRHLK